MPWLQIALLILQLLKQFKGSVDAEQFATDVQASGSLPQANGEFLKWLWENRQQILEFIKMLIDMVPTNPPATTLAEETDIMAQIDALILELQS